jgi:hypothetical protein
MDGIQIGDIVRHKDDPDLIRGKVKKIFAGRALVEFMREDNPGLPWRVTMFYRFDLLEKVE